MRKKYEYLLLLLIVMVFAVYVHKEVGLLFSVIFFIYTAIPGLFLYYLFYIKKIKLNLRFILLIVFGYLWATVTSFFINDIYVSIALFFGISIGILASFLYHFYKNRKNTTL